MMHLSIAQDAPPRSCTIRAFRRRPSWIRLRPWPPGHCGLAVRSSRLRWTQLMLAHYQQSSKSVPMMCTHSCTNLHQPKGRACFSCSCLQWAGMLHGSLPCMHLCCLLCIGNPPLVSIMCCSTVASRTAFPWHRMARRMLWCRESPMAAPRFQKNLSCESCRQLNPFST